MKPTPAQILFLAAAGALAFLPACTSSGPKLKDRNGATAAEQINELGRRRAEAVRLAQDAETYEQDDPAKAIETYKAALREDDSLHNAWNNLGMLLMNQGQYADAVSAFQAAGDLMPGDPRPMYNIGLAYQRNGWGEEAYRHFNLALERDPSHLPSMRGFVRAAEMTGRADDSVIDVIRRATMRETDAQWKSYFERQRYRVEAVLDIRR
jgi:tetratricopeptide (TPR) repeat protein